MKQSEFKLKKRTTTKTTATNNFNDSLKNKSRNIIILYFMLRIEGLNSI